MKHKVFSVSFVYIFIKQVFDNSFEEQVFVANVNQNITQCYQNKDKILSAVTSEAF